MRRNVMKAMQHGETRMTKAEEMAKPTTIPPLPLRGGEDRGEGAERWYRQDAPRSSFRFLSSFVIRHSSFVLALCFLGAARSHAQSFLSMSGGDTRTFLLIKADGSCLLTNDTVQSRKMLELQINSWQ